jgi:hypothetical protein
VAGLDLETLLVDQRKISFVGHKCGESYICKDQKLLKYLIVYN